MNYFLSLLLCFVLLASCNSDSGSGKNEKDTAATVKSITSPMDEMNRRTEELKKLPSLTLEQMKALLPEEIDGVKQKNYSASTNFGYAIATSEYPKNSSNTTKITLYDCAGEAGSAWYATTYLGFMNLKQETDKESIHTTDFMGGKAIENYKKDMNYSTLTYMVNDRLLVIMEGKGKKPEDLKLLAQKLALKIS